MSAAPPRPAGAARPCRVCGAGDQLAVLHLDEVPALCCSLWPTEEAARQAPRGVIDLRFCGRCGLLYNAGFSSETASYSPEYENSIHFSPLFQDYIEGQAKHLVERYDLRGKEIVEIGCGSGDFLAALCLLGDNRGIGYDPSHDPARAADSGGRVMVSTDPYPLEGTSAQFVVSRHVLEHMEDPAGLVTAVRRSLGDRTDAVVYFEVPDAMYMLEASAIWDVIHEHCSYFTEPTLRWLFERCGFETIETGRSFGGEYLWIEARPAAAPAGDPAPPDVTAVVLPVQDFGRTYRRTVEQWRQRLAGLGPGRIAVWGAGAKGVMFLTVVDRDRAVRRVVDVNHHKRGRHLPVTGQPVVAPADLEGDPPDAVVVMNPLYTDEIGRSLAEYGIDVPLLPA